MYLMVRPLNPERWSDAELLAGIAEHDRATFGVFYRRHLPRVVAFLLRETHDRELSADLAAEVFAAVIVSARRYRPTRETADPWVLAIARNTLGMSRRRGRVEKRARQRLGFEALALHDSDLDRVEALAQGEVGPLTELVDALPDLERQAVRARVIEERSYRVIAADLECSELVARKRVSRGMARVRNQITES